MKKTALMDLVALSEGFTAEFKRAGTSNLGREICAFANATGGVILIEVSDNGQDESQASVETGGLGTVSVPSLSQACPKSVPDKPRSSKQRYRLTELGQELLKRQGKEQS